MSVLVESERPVGAGMPGRPGGGGEADFPYESPEQEEDDDEGS